MPRKGSSEGHCSHMIEAQNTCYAQCFLLINFKKMKKKKTDVIFRVDADGEPLAVFPHEVADLNGNMSCYAHYGQHSACAPSYIRRLKKADGSAFDALREELTALGYDLREINRINGKKYSDSLRSVRDLVSSLHLDMEDLELE